VGLSDGRAGRDRERRKVCTGEGMSGKECGNGYVLNTSAGIDCREDESRKKFDKTSTPGTVIDLLEPAIVS
jgi:hypothetical protein